MSNSDSTKNWVHEPGAQVRCVTSAFLDTNRVANRQKR